jgi:hypothetical protein
MDGIESMVKLRGGLKTIGLNHYLTHMVLWQVHQFDFRANPLTPSITRVDYLYAAITNTKPRFPTSLLFPKQAHFPQPPASPPLQPAFPACTISLDLEVILHQLRSASQFLADIETSMTDLDFYAFGIKRAIILDSILDLRICTTVDQCCRDAVMLYVLTVLTSMNHGVCRDLVAGLRRNLEELDLGMLWEEAPGLLFWMLLVGGGGAPSNADRAWFVEGLGTCLSRCEWEEVVERLEGWPWRPKYCGSWKVVWRDAVKAKEFGKVVEIS